MPCFQPFRDDSAQLLLFKIASCIEAGGGGSGGVISFNSRTGVVTLTSGDVTGALGFTPLNTTTGDARYVLKAGDTMTGALAMPAGSAALPSNTFSGDTNTGMYSPAADSVGFSTGGTLRLTVANAAVTSTVPILAPDGTAALPGFAFSGGAGTTGMYRISAGNLGFSAAGVLALTVNSTSLISVGTILSPDGTAALPAHTFSADTDTGIYRIGANSLGISAGGVLRLTVGGTSTTSVGTFLIPDGTAALPGLAFSADTDTGIYRIGANALGISVGGTRVTSYNSVGLGIGTDAATFKLSLVGTATTADRKIGINGTQVVYLPDQAAGAFLGSIFLGNGGTSLSHAAALEGQNNTGIGVSALVAITTGANNVALGYQALLANTSGFSNAAFGSAALVAVTTGDSNLAVGTQSLAGLTTGSRNVAIGSQALASITTSSNNVAIGHQALVLNTSGGNNVAIGYLALFDLAASATGQNTAVGYNTGRGLTTGNFNTILGANVTGLAAALSNTIIIADGAGVQRIIVDSSGNTTFAGTTATSDGTAALPSKTFSSDLNTGDYRIGADSIGTSTGGVLRITTNTTDVILATAFRLAMASGANQRAGNAVLVGGTITVANTSVTANTIVMLTRKTSGGTIGTAITYTTIAATSFTINSDSVIDTSTFSYLLIEVP